MLWAYRTTSRQPIGETPFTMTYKTEVVIPTELGLHTLRSQLSEETLTGFFDLLEEKRLTASIKLAAYQQCAIAQQHKRIRHRIFRPGDLVLRRTFDDNKLKPNWEGLFKVTSESNGGACHRESMFGVPKTIPMECILFKSLLLLTKAKCPLTRNAHQREMSTKVKCSLGQNGH